MKKNCFALVLLFISINTFSINKLVIKYTDIERETPFDISCDDLDDINWAEEYIIFNKKEIKSVYKEIKKANNIIPVYEGIDARIKFLFYRKSKVEKYCMDFFYIKGENFTYEVTDKFRDFITDFVESKKQTLYKK